MVLLLQLVLFNLLTRAFNLPTRAFSILTRGFELVTRNSCFTFLLSTDVWHFSWPINSCWKFILSWHLVIPKRNNSFIRLYEKRLFSNPKIIFIKSTNKTKRIIWNVFYCASTCIYVKNNVAISNVIDSDPRKKIFS